MRLAWFSPLPPIPSGIADYSFEMLPLVAEHARVDTFSPGAGALRRLRVPGTVRRFSPSAFDRMAHRYDAVLYHLGNNPHHAFAYREALHRPGVAVFHDFVLHHMIGFQLMDGPHRDWPAYEELMASTYGQTGRRLAELRMRGVATDFEKFLFPLNEHVARQARGLVVHSDDVRDRMEEIAPSLPVTVIPHHAGSPPASVRGYDRPAARRRLGLPADGFLVGQFGYVTAPKQPSAVIGGFARLAVRHPEAELLIVGADHSGGGLERLVRRHALQGRVRLTGFVDLEVFYLYLKAVDVLVNLRYPSAGESSGTFARALAEGRVTLVNDVGSFAAVPSTVALKVEVDRDQAAEVGEHLLRLADDPEYRRTIEARAREYAATVLDPRRCARLYVEAALRAASGESAPIGFPAASPA